MKKLLSLFILFPTLLMASVGDRLSFNDGWQFRNQEELKSNSQPNEKEYSFAQWPTVTLPHTAKIEPKVVVNPWSGISWYTKTFTLDKNWKNKRLFIEFEGVMQKADVWVNGVLVKTHFGGYLPFTIDITELARFDQTNRIVVKADNSDNADIPPGKSISTLDFCYFSGIYRNVHLYATDLLHVTDNNFANKVASGGVYVWYPEVSKKTATVAIATHLQNDDKTTREFQLQYQLIDKVGKVVTRATSAKLKVEAGKEIAVNQKINVNQPLLWHPNHPNLYTLKIDVVDKGKISPQKSIKIGIRKYEIRESRFYINGEPFLLTGTNRHQEYPFIGNALSDNAQYRDAVKIKEAGYNIVRLSHYPQAVSFMDACDELGILTIAAIPGWQFVGGDLFKERSYDDARNLIRRDRNHPSVIMWELSLNESEMPDAYMKRMNEIAREESPQTKLITCGWIDRFYDVYIPARQHAKFPDYWKKYKGKIPLFTGEYGDWEYYAQDAGLNQAGYAGLPGNERTSRQLRGDGEKRLLQQAYNYQEAHNDNLVNPHLGDANWLIFDYNRGYSPDIESSGVMDIFRLPKFAYYFYRTQVAPNSATAYNGAATVKIASYWNEKSNPNAVKVYANCDEVALYLNDKLVERKKAVRDVTSQQLKYPPFVFDLKKYEAGALKAVGYSKGKVVAQDIVHTAGAAAQLKLTYDRSGKNLKADGSDVVFVYATVTDSKGNIVPQSDAAIQFTVKGDAKIVGENPVKAEAGVATILLQSGKTPGAVVVEVSAANLKSGTLVIPVTK